MGSSTRSSRYGRDSWFRRLYTLLSALAARSESTSIRLEEREETLEVILDNLGEGVLATDLDGRPVFANPKARKILGIEGQKRPPEEIPISLRTST
jgi:PAS domain-containing protein